MEILNTIGTVAYGVLLVILGLNAVIIVHELGHFIIARLCGVRCEKFYIWFDFWGLKFFKFKWGDTEYGLGLFPLGGYVKMLGQEDNPGAIQAEIERAKQQCENTNDTAEPQPVFSPESYLSKSVPQRLAIIVAGVIMNFLFAIVCAAGAYMVGVEEFAPAVGGVVPGSPAWTAGLQTGDKFIAIDGKPARTYGDVKMKMVAGTNPVQWTIERQGETLTFDIAPRKRTGDLMPNIGVALPLTLELFSRQQFGQWKKYYSTKAQEALNKGTEDNPLRLEKVDGQTINNYTEYQEAQFKKIGESITCTFNHSTPPPQNHPLSSPQEGNNSVDVEIPALPMRMLPLRFKMGTIAAVQTGSDAEKQGIKAGDTIVSVDGIDDFDPLKLPQILLRKVNAEQKMVELVIQKAEGAEQTLTLELKPTRILSDLGGLSMRDALCSTALGLAWNVEPVIAGVDESKLLPGQALPAVGDRIVRVDFINGEISLPKNSFSTQKTEGLIIHGIDGGPDDRRVDIPYIFTYLLQEARTQKSQKGEAEKMLSVRLTLESPILYSEPAKVVHLPVLDADDWFQLDRGFGFQFELTVTKAGGLGEALSRGTVRTVEYSLLVYQSVYSLINGTVSPKALNGPVGIVEILYKIALAGPSEFLMLLCLIGANLAVINLLPIPPLDGGHVLFLLYEGIFRRLPNELVQVVLSYFGLFLIILLMVWTVSLDLSCIPRW